MPRDVYYQQHGNPIQRDRLPSTRPEVCPSYFPSPDQPPWSVIGFVLALAVVFFACLAGTFVDGLLGIPLSAALFLPVAFWYSLHLLISGRTESLCRLLITLTGLATLLLAHSAPTAVLLGLAALAIGLLTWLIGSHWTATCTAPPVDPAEAITLHRRWQPTLILAGIVPLILFGLATFMDSMLLGGASLLAFGMIRTKGLCLTDLSGSALAAWCRQHSDRASISGLATRLTSTWSTRMGIACVCMLAVATAWIRTSLEWQGGTQWTAPAGNGTEAVAFLHRYGPDGDAEGKGTLPLIILSGLAGTVPLLLTVGLPLVLAGPVLKEAAAHRPKGVDASNWHGFINEIQHSPDPIESQSYYMGRVASDNSPVLIPRRVFNNHAHFLGDSGGGKTSLGLAPWIEQTVNFGDCSVIVVDLKADSLELLASLQAAADTLHQRTGRRLPLKCFSNQSTLPTYAFNPLMQPYWSDFDPYVKTDILCGAAGLIYGTDYGAGWYTAANAAVLHHAIQHFPDVRTFEELALRVNETVTKAKKTELHSELRSAGVHVQAVLDRLGSFDALNVVPGRRFSDAVVEQAIDLTDVFRRPQLLYFHLSSTLAPGSSPEIARFLVYSLLAASTQTDRKHQVYLVIDEFQRMASHNVEYMLQLARSMGVGIILANQSMDDLGDLITPVEANCRVRQWFSVSSDQDRQRLARTSGEMIETFEDITRTRTSNGSTTVARRLSKQVMPRLSPNDIALASDHDMRSILTITRGDGYAQYGGLPFIAESAYHISESEYEHRKATPWPEPTEGMFVPRDIRRLAQPLPQRPGPTITSEIIGDFDFRDLPGPRKPRRGNKGRRRDQGDKS